ALDDVGTRVYESCDGVHMASDLINMLCGLYEGPLEVIQQDVFDLLRQFAEAKLIRQNPEDFIKKEVAA
ncbi:MAG TPA: PqqD family protein, partial [Verrucomicrobiae bacterium]